MMGIWSAAFCGLPLLARRLWLKSLFDIVRACRRMKSKMASKEDGERRWCHYRYWGPRKIDYPTINGQVSEFRKLTSAQYSELARGIMIAFHYKASKHEFDEDSKVGEKPIDDDYGKCLDAMTSSRYKLAEARSFPIIDASACCLLFMTSASQAVIMHSIQFC